MCTHKRWITNKYTGARFLAPCGHCKACLQEKAIYRSNRIRSEYDDHSEIFFGMLSYDPDSVPYVKYESLQNHDEILSVYRRCRIKWNVHKQKYIKQRGEFKLFDVVSGIDDQDRFWFYQGFGRCRWLKHQPHKVGVCYYKDFQDFVKRLRISLQRDGYNIKHKFFACSEYGEHTQRPHFHFLLFAEPGYEEVLRSYVIKNWSYGNHIRHPKSFQRVIDDPASYVSSYVNSGSKFSSFLARNFAPKSSYSKLFGHHRDVYQLDKIQECIDRGDLSFIMPGIGQFDSSRSHIRLPKYVINRWFPLFKGYSRLSSDKVSDFIRSYFNERVFKSYSGYYDSLNPRYPISWTDEDIRKISVRFKNTFLAYQEATGIKNVQVALDLYAEQYARVWKLFKTTSYRLLQEDPSLACYKYDNFCIMRPRKRLLALENLKAPDDFVLDPNEYPPELARTLNLILLYDVYCKNKEITNIVMSDNGIYV